MSSEGGAAQVAPFFVTGALYNRGARGLLPDPTLVEVAPRSLMCDSGGVTDLPQPPLDPRLQAAIEAVYGQFAGSAPHAVEGCPCCIDTRRVDELLANPLRSLTGAMLWRYVTGAFLTVGGERDFRYLLPRILDLAVKDPGSLPNVEIVLGKLRLVGWSTWPQDDRDPIDTLIGLWFEQALARDIAEAEEWLSGSQAESILCGAARADLNIAPWLAQLAEPAAEPVRAEIIRWHGRRLSSDAPPPGFWEDAPDGWRALAAMLRT